ncbi:MAG: hypothetical protein R6V13_09050 [Anaerolineae bacterium]
MHHYVTPTTKQTLRRHSTRIGQEHHLHGTLWVLDELACLFIVSPTETRRALERMLDTGSRFPEADCVRRLALWAQDGMPGDYRESDE